MGVRLVWVRVAGTGVGAGADAGLGAGAGTWCVTLYFDFNY